MQDISLSSKAFRAVRWTTLNSICQVGIQFLTLVILGRVLDPRAFGLMAMIMVVVEIVNVFARMGLSEAIIYKKTVTHNELSSLYLLNILMGLILFIVVFISSSFIGQLYSEPSLTPLIIIISPLFLISSLGIIFEVLLRKNLMFDSFSKINILSHLTSFVFMVVLAILKAGVYALVLGQICFHTVKSVLLLLFAWKQNWLPGLRLNLSEVKFYLKFGFFRVMAMFANQINSRVDQFLVGAILGAEVLGFYNVAFRIIYVPINKVNPILTQVAFPFFSKIQDNTSRLKKNYLKYINLIVSINAGILVGITSLAHILVPLFLGKKWMSSVPIIQALIVYVVIRSILNASGALTMAKGKANWSFYWHITMLFIIPGTTYLALEVSNSVIGVCIALSGLFFALLFVHYRLFLRNLVGPFFVEYLQTIAKPLSLAASMGLLIYMLSLLIHDMNYLLKATILITIGIVYYTTATFIFNKLFVEELAKYLPRKAVKILFWIRYKFNISNN